MLTRRSLVTILYDPYKLKGSFFLLYPTWNRSTHVYPTQNRLIGAILTSLLSLFMGGASVFLYVSSPEGYFPPPFSRGTVFLPRRVLLIPPQKVARVLLILLLILPQEVARVLLLFFPLIVGVLLSQSDSTPCGAFPSMSYSSICCHRSSSWMLPP